MKQTRGTTIIVCLCALAFALCAGQVCAAAAAVVNYDTAWTYVYDSGQDTMFHTGYQDWLFDVKVKPNGNSICVGQSNGTTLMIELDKSGKTTKIKSYNDQNLTGSFKDLTLHSIALARNGDLLVGGGRRGGPWIMRLDSLWNVKWTTWYYDSLRDRNILFGNAVVNCIQETGNGKIITAAGDAFPDNYGRALNNYAACLVMDSAGKVINGAMQLWKTDGYKLSGFYIDYIGSRYFISGNQGVVCVIDSSLGGFTRWYKKYTFSLDGVGTVTNNVSRAKKLRNGTIMVAGQAYEGNCWTNYKRFYWDAWWSPIDFNSGQNTAWDTAGKQGDDDIIYDFTQLKNGNLVFVGTKAGVDGVWALVTDSTGKNVLWEKGFSILYKTEIGYSARPFSVCASPDSGFTVTGEYRCAPENGGTNAFAAHFISKTVGVVARPKQLQPGFTTARCTVDGARVVFSLTQPVKTSVTITLYRANGRMIKKLTSENTVGDDRTISLDVSNAGKGLYVYAMNAGAGVLSGTVMVGE